MVLGYFSLTGNSTTKNCVAAYWIWRLCYTMEQICTDKATLLLAKLRLKFDSTNKWNSMVHWMLHKRIANYQIQADLFGICCSWVYKNVFFLQFFYSSFSWSIDVTSMHMRRCFLSHTCAILLDLPDMTYLVNFSFDFQTVGSIYIRILQVLAPIGWNRI